MFINGLPRGGAETQFLRVARALLAAGYEVRIFVLLPENDFAADVADIPVTLLAPRPGPGSVLGAVRALREWRPGLVLSFLYQSSVVARVAATLARVPVIVSSMRNERLETRLRTEVYRATGLLDAATVANSQPTAEVLVANRTVRAAKMRVIPNGLEAPPVDEAARATVRAELGVPDEAFLFLGVGRLNPQKDWANLVRAVQGYSGPPARWLIAGTGALEDELRAQIGAAGLEGTVVLLGLRHDVPQLLGAADALVLASHYEGLPNVVLEAMAAARPVVATQVGACADLLGTDGGLLAPPRNSAALSAAMADLANRSPAQRRAMGARNAELVRERYSLAAADREWVALVDGLLVGAGLPVPLRPVVAP